MDHVCNVVQALLRKRSTELEHPLFGAGGGSAALASAADWFEENTQECYDFFWKDGPDQLVDADYCSGDFNGGFEHAIWEPGNGPNTTVFGASVSDFAVSLTTIVNPPGVLTLPSSPTSCNTPIDNDDNLPPLADVDPTAVRLLAAASTGIDVVGPPYQGDRISGSGDFGTGPSATLDYFTTGSDLVIDAWEMEEAAPTTVGTTGITSTVSRFRMRLVGEELAAIQSRYYTIMAGAATFQLGASVDGITEVVYAQNDSDIRFYYQAPGFGDCPPSSPSSCIVNRPFTISYTDAFGERWDLDIDGTTWAP